MTLTEAVRGHAARSHPAWRIPLPGFRAAYDLSGRRVCRQGQFPCHRLICEDALLVDLVALMLYAIEQPRFGGAWLLREREDEPLVEEVRALLDAVENEQVALPQWLQLAFAPWLSATRHWLDLPASAADDERLREVVDRLRAYGSLLAKLRRNHDRD